MDKTVESGVREVTAEKIDNFLAQIDALVRIVEEDVSGPETSDEPDDSCVGWKADENGVQSELPMTFGHVRRARYAVNELRRQHESHKTMLASLEAMQDRLTLPALSLSGKQGEDGEVAAVLPETVAREVARIRAACTPKQGDAEDLITYAREVVSLRSSQKKTRGEGHTYITDEYGNRGYIVP